MRRRTRVGIICGSLAQAGTERYVYELCRGLDKRRFAVELLTIAPWGVGRQYYAKPIRRLGIPIRPLFPLFHGRRLPQVLRRCALAGQKTYRSWILPALLSSYDLLVAIHLDYLADVAFMLPHDSRVVLHLTTHLCQHPYDYYRSKYPRDLSVFLVCMDPYQAQQAREGLGSAIRGETVVPLPIDTTEFEEITDWAKVEPIIASFIRIEPDRDHMPLLRAFAILAKECDAQLRCYGRGNPTYLKAEAARLGIEGRVHFPGHASDMRRTVIDDHVAMAWLSGADDFMGYSAIELSLLGVPVCSYNLVGNMPAEAILRKTKGAVHSYKSETQLAHASLALLRNPQLLRELGSRLRSHVLSYNDSKHLVGRIEAFYQEVLRETGSERPTDRDAKKIA